MVAQFSKEGMVALALQLTTKIDEIVGIVKRLVEVFKNEFIPSASINEDFIIKVIEEWHENGTLTFDK